MRDNSELIAYAQTRMLLADQMCDDISKAYWLAVLRDLEQERDRTSA